MKMNRVDVRPIPSCPLWLWKYFISSWISSYLEKQGLSWGLFCFHLSFFLIFLLMQRLQTPVWFNSVIDEERELNIVCSLKEKLRFWKTYWRSRDRGATKCFLAGCLDNIRPNGGQYDVCSLFTVSMSFGLICKRRGKRLPFPAKSATSMPDVTTCHRLRRHRRRRRSNNRLH